MSYRPKALASYMPTTVVRPAWSSQETSLRDLPVSGVIAARPLRSKTLACRHKAASSQAPRTCASTYLLCQDHSRQAIIRTACESP
jgi:hypothetical protein